MPSQKPWDTLFQCMLTDKFIFFFNAPLKIDTFPVIYLFIYLFPTRHFYPTIPVFLLPRGFIFLLAKKEKLGEDVMQVWAVQRPL